MRKFLVVGLLILAVTLTGCVGNILNNDDSPFGDITKLTIADLSAALVRATAADDKPAMMCYPVLIQVIQNLPDQAPDSKVAGIVDAFEAARLASKRIQSFSGANNQIIQYVNLGCAALYNDAKADILRLGIKFRP